MNNNIYRFEFQKFKVPKMRALYEHLDLQLTFNIFRYMYIIHFNQLFTLNLVSISSLFNARNSRPRQ